MNKSIDIHTTPWCTKFKWYELQGTLQGRAQCMLLLVLYRVYQQHYQF